MANSLTPQDIIHLLPYTEPFLFVDELLSISGEGIKGTYTFNADAFYYKGHFKDNPVTPGVILTECMAQIGVVCLGIYLLSKENPVPSRGFVMSSSEMDFYLPVFPGATVTVLSEKLYFRFNKLKCKVKMVNDKQEVIAKGFISGMAGLQKI
ncbi:MAG TPA: FabA/FabZ family ACP-dehydratase [Aequorivita sp.]|nr:FabA/FabZ family ACP-dehydratase [Aequorivita sp.]